jgi:hypothetical protein
LIFEKKPRLGAETGAAVGDAEPEAGGNAGRGAAHAVNSATHPEPMMIETRLMKSVFSQSEITQTNVWLLHCNIAIELNAPQGRHIVARGTDVFERCRHSYASSREFQRVLQYQYHRETQ